MIWSLPVPVIMLAVYPAPRSTLPDLMW